MKKIIFLFVSLFWLAACKPDKLVGVWVQPVDGQAGEEQGFVLNNDGSAASVNMHTLLYDSWKRKGQVLVLSGKSVGNGQTIDFVEEYEIRHADENVLELRMGDYVTRYTRKINQPREMH